ncbi:MAG TPA: sigma 54-interacting transcriptional regulator, partial [Methylomirabilota bacterium]|nr:sigma 54-interacting transcriptional regulator [Methylomirabilota bacterium]
MTHDTPKVLIVDDESEIRSILADCLRPQGLEVAAAEDGAAGLERFRAVRPDVVLLDLKMPKMGGLDALPEIKRIDPEVPVIICTAAVDVPTAVQAMKLGAYDYVTKPFDADLLVLTVKRALERRALQARIEDLKSLGEGTSLAERMGASAKIQEIIRQVAQVAKSTFTVIIQGETGTGKELVARAIHQQSARRNGPFVAVDCGAIPETLVESELFGYEKGAFTGANRRKEGHFQFA